ncbi:MAG: hypothetical protein ACR2PL_01860 [Dehalococcoidia bacterium]
MFFLKACAKCHGDLITEGRGIDRWGEPADIVCIQCGYTARPGERETLVRKMDEALAKRRTSPVAVERRAAAVG